MKGLRRQRYTKEFKEEAVKLVTEQGLGVMEAAKRLSLPSATLSTWLANTMAGKTHEPGLVRDVSDKEAELTKLRRENTELRMEVEILKKATAYFAKGSLAGTHS